MAINLETELNNLRTLTWFNANPEDKPVSKLTTEYEQAFRLSPGIYVMAYLKPNKFLFVFKTYALLNIHEIIFNGDSFNTRALNGNYIRYFFLKK